MGSERTAKRLHSETTALPRSPSLAKQRPQDEHPRPVVHACVIRGPGRDGGRIRLQYWEADKDTLVIQLGKVVARNKRKWVRKRRKLKVELQTAHNWSPAHARDVSAGGVFVVTDHFRSIGSRVKMRIWLHGGVQMVSSQVRWIRSAQLRRGLAEPRGMGLRFHRLSPSAAKALASVLRA